MSVCDKSGTKGNPCTYRENCKRRKGLELLFEYAMEKSGFIPNEFKSSIGFIIKECPDVTPI